MYHMMVAPTLFDDVDGQYRGMDCRNHRLPPGAHNYSTFSLWDTYRARHPITRYASPASPRYRELPHAHGRTRVRKASRSGRCKAERNGLA